MSDRERRAGSTFYESGNYPCDMMGACIVLLCYTTLMSSALQAYDRYRSLCTLFNPLRPEMALKIYISFWVYSLSCAFLIRFIGGYEQFKLRVACVHKFQSGANYAW